MVRLYKFTGYHPFATSKYYSGKFPVYNTLVYHLLVMLQRIKRCEKYCEGIFGAHGSHCLLYEVTSILVAMIVGAHIFFR